VCRRLVAHGRGRSVPHNTRTLTSHHSLGAPRWRRNPLGGVAALDGSAEDRIRRCRERGWRSRRRSVRHRL